MNKVKDYNLYIEKSVYRFAPEFTEFLPRYYCKITARSAHRKLTDHALNLADDEKQKCNWENTPKVLRRGLFARILLTAEGFG